MRRLFEIQTLSECQPKLADYRRLNDYRRLADPVSIILGIGSVISSLFPNLFGSEKTSRSVFDKLFPSNGYWTSQYKNYLLSKIVYIKDIERDLHMYTGEFIEMHVAEICAGKSGTDCWQAFYSLLQQESSTGGLQPVGNIFGAGLNYQTLLLVGGGVLLLVALTKKKRGRRK
jgi:hypothetical protein